MSDSKYEGREARGILGACAEQLYPFEARRAKREAALELFGALADLKVPGVSIVLAKPGRPVSIAIGTGKGHFGDPLLNAEVDYDSDNDKFRVVVEDRIEYVSLAYNHAEQRFEGDVGANATDDQRKRSALAAIANKIVTMARAK